jgi:hypothetical protein
MQSISSNPDVAAATNQIERLVETTPAYRDYVRQGLITFSKHHIGDQQNLPIDDSSEYSSVGEELSPFRLCTLNVNYQLCRSYPCLFVVPRETSDECIRKNAKCHRQNRLLLEIVIEQRNVRAV